MGSSRPGSELPDQNSEKFTMRASENYGDRWVLFCSLLFPNLYQVLILGNRKQIQDIFKTTALDRNDQQGDVE